MPVMTTEPLLVGSEEAMKASGSVPRELTPLVSSLGATQAPACIKLNLGLAVGTLLIYKKAELAHAAPSLLLYENALENMPGDSVRRRRCLCLGHA